MNAPHGADAWLCLLLARGLGPTRTGRVVRELGSAQAVIEADAPTLRRALGGGLPAAQRVVDALREVVDTGALDREKAAIERCGVRLIPQDDPAYPPRLARIDDPPPVLFARGELTSLTASPALAIVGSRRATRYGLEQADRFATLAAEAGYVVVSGGAYGVDAAAHHAVERLSLPTIAVLGSGLEHPYPADHADLFARIPEAGGAVISEFPMTVRVHRRNFPRRNRVIAGLADGVLVIEAAVRSGALITARVACEQQRRPVFALPGHADSPASAGCHELIRNGKASLAYRFEHIARELDAARPDAQLTLFDALTPRAEAGSRADRDPSALPDASSEAAPTSTDAAPASGSPEQAAILQALREPLDFDALVHITGLDPGLLQGQLTMLQILGRVRRDGPKYRRPGGDER